MSREKHQIRQVQAQSAEAFMYKEFEDMTELEKSTYDLWTSVSVFIRAV